MKKIIFPLIAFSFLFVFVNGCDRTEKTKALSENQDPAQETLAEKYPFVFVNGCDRTEKTKALSENQDPAQETLAEKYPSVFPESWKKAEMLVREYRNLKPGVDYYHFHFKTFEDTGKPLSVYLLEIDWKKAAVKAQTAVCGRNLQTVADMVKDRNVVAAVNGAYFYYTPPAPYFDIKCSGTLHEA